MFIWSYGWCFEDNKAWFVDGMSNTLFSVDLDTGECDKISCIPNSENGVSRMNPYCVKCGKDIYCIPGFGQSMWIYNLDDETFTEVNIDRPKEHLAGSQFWIWGGMIYITASNWNKLIEVSIKQRVITNYYIICENDSIQRSILAENNIYAVSSKYSRIYQFDLLTKKVSTYFLTDNEKNLFAICYDGKKFWLSGYQKEVYMWEKDKNNLFSLDFPKDFEIYNIDNYGLPMFERVIEVGEYIWFIPIGAEKIMYVKKNTDVLKIFEINEKNRIGMLWQEYQELASYVFQYVRDNRYIGLFSAKNRRVLEIDAEQLSYQWKEYYFSEQYLKQYSGICEGIYYEGWDPMYSQVYYNMWGQTAGYKIGNINTNSVGAKIYTRLVEGNL